MNSFLFIGLPYASLIFMLVGSIFVYNNSEYRFTSLSTQLLEGNKLYKGANLFHWGLIFLFFGHLFAFVIPSSVIAFNRCQVRLLLLEASAFGFALSSLLGLTILIHRRITDARIRVVTSKPDVLVFILLFSQIVSGLCVAYFYRWGSSWFAAMLTPYLYSLFTFAPDIKSIELLPLTVKFHLVSAFIIVGIIPFTRFLHFLVYPIGYFFRSPQIVMWNRDHKVKRESDNISGEGLPPKNN